MICKNCGKEYADEFDFCPYCGKKRVNNRRSGLCKPIEYLRYCQEPAFREIAKRLQKMPFEEAHKWMETPTAYPDVFAVKVKNHWNYERDHLNRPRRMDTVMTRSDLMYWIDKQLTEHRGAVDEIYTAKVPVSISLLRSYLGESVFYTEEEAIETAEEWKKLVKEKIDEYKRNLDEEDAQLERLYDKDPLYQAYMQKWEKLKETGTELGGEQEEVSDCEL